MNDLPQFVESQTGLIRRVCVVGCDADYCAQAHPNNVMSVVRHPKWCLRGSRHTCTVVSCPFNHFRHTADFVIYRSASPLWAENNPELLKQYGRDIVMMEMYQAQKIKKSGRAKSQHDAKFRG